MDSRRLGRTGLDVPPLGLGTVKLGRNAGVKYPERFDLPTDAEVQHLLETAVDLGAYFWDTAPSYGISEERLGKHIPGLRDRIVLCSKAGESFGPEGSAFDFSRTAITKSVEASLRRLGTDYLDLLLLHSDGNDVGVLNETDALEALVEAKQAGKARAIGISAKTSEGIALAAETLDVIMAPFGRNHQSLLESLQAAHDHGCGVLAIKVLDQGHAVVTGRDGDPIAESLRFVAESGVADVAVVGTKSADHLRNAVAIMENLERSRV